MQPSPQHYEAAANAERAVPKEHRSLQFSRSVYAARTVVRNLPTSVLSRVLSLDSDLRRREHLRGCRAGLGRAALHVGDVGGDLLGALRRLLHVAGDFLGRCTLLFHRGRDGRGDFRQPLDGAEEISLIAPTESLVAAWMPEICWPISPVAFAVCSASAFTSEATTAKPRPASPARAASMVAFSASRLVWPAMVLISSTTSPMREAAFDNSLTRSVVARAWPTASPAIRADSCT